MSAVHGGVGVGELPGVGAEARLGALGLVRARAAGVGRARGRAVRLGLTRSLERYGRKPPHTLHTAHTAHTAYLIQAEMRVAVAGFAFGLILEGALLPYVGGPPRRPGGHARRRVHVVVHPTHRAGPPVVLGQTTNQAVSLGYRHHRMPHTHDRTRTRPRPRTSSSGRWASTRRGTRIRWRGLDRSSSRRTRCAPSHRALAEAKPR